MLIIVSNHILFSLLTFGSKKFTAMAVWPFILTRLSKNDLEPTLINHEKIHLRQQLEWLLLGFYLLYLAEWLLHLMRLKDKSAAYMAISFEKEAYSHEKELEYLNQRKLYANYRWKH